MSDKRFQLACVQVTSTNEVAENIDTVSALIDEAAAGGADFIALPETVGVLETRRRELFPRITSQDEDAALKAWRAQAKARGVWLLIGSLMIKIAEDKAANRSFLIDDRGEIRASYDKIHMFDVDLPGGESYRESKSYRPGDKAVIAATPWGKLGMSICYDLRFPYLYRTLAKGGAEMLAVPAAFTQPTGEAHWHTLLRARAIETGSFVFAPAQTGTHATGRKTYGHSLIVDPWGVVLADGGRRPGVVTAEIDLARVGEVRSQIPSLTHDRLFTLTAPD